MRRSWSRICRWLEGLPLAIELAAAQTKWYPPQALLAQLNKRMPILVGGTRYLAPRQQTLRNAIDWSYDLLAPLERRVFTSLAVFAGGCTAEAAAVVVGPSVADADTQLDILLQSLVDQSLLRFERGPDNTMHYAMFRRSANMPWSD